VAYRLSGYSGNAIDAEHQKLRRRNEEIHTILNGIQDFIIVITPNREIMEVNEAFLNQMGYTREEVIGRKCYEVFQKLYSECTSDRIQCPLNEAVQSRKPSQNVLTRIDHGDRQHYIDVKIFPCLRKTARFPNSLK